MCTFPIIAVLPSHIDNKRNNRRDENHNELKLLALTSLVLKTNARLEL